MCLFSSVKNAHICLVPMLQGYDVFANCERAEIVTNWSQNKMQKVSGHYPDSMVKAVGPAQAHSNSQNGYNEWKIT